ncbi:MAG: SH3 domain-containing protein [Candidatus Electryoneaceae bacterium]|nr:SH3 domain-containing protein [Candidatus Electryoneaceae bacterium]
MRIYSKIVLFILLFAVTIPTSAKEVLIANSSKVYERRGPQQGLPDSTYAVVGTVKKGEKVTKKLLKGYWYKIKLSDGTKGWVHQNSIIPPGGQEARLKYTVYANPDTNNFYTRAPTHGEHRIKKGTKVELLRYVGNYCEVKLLDERIIWTKAFVVETKGSVPANASAVFFYRIFRFIDDIGKLHWTLTIIFVIFWWGFVLALPSLLGIATCYETFGRIRTLPNAIIKFLMIPIIPITAMQFHRFFMGVPPYINHSMWLQFLHLGMVLLMIKASWWWVGTDRCPSCHRVHAGEEIGTEMTGKQHHTSKSTSTYSDGSKSVKTNYSTTEQHSDYQRCAYCGHHWTYHRTERSSGHN